MYGFTSKDAVEMGVHFAPFMAMGVAAIFYKIKWYFAEKRRNSEEHRAFMNGLVEKNDKRQEYECRAMMFETWDEVHNKKRAKTANCSIGGYFAAEMDKFSDGERAAVYSGRYAAADHIRNARA